MGGGISQLVAFPTIYGPLSLYVAYAAVILVIIGLIIAFLGLYWRWGPWKRPLGITLMVISFVFVGFVSILLGGWLYTPLFLLAIASFAVTWLLLTGRSYGLLAVAALAILGLLASIIGVTNDGVVYVPGMLGAFYTFWYINRPHVTKYFKEEPFTIKVTRRRLVQTLVLAVLAPLPLAYLYVNPPSRTIASIISGNGGGVSSPEYYFRNGDTLIYKFQVDPSSAPIEFSIRQDVPSSIMLAQETGRSGSGTVNVFFSAQYYVWFEPRDSWAELSFEIIVILTSWRRSIIQWGLLDIYLMILLLSMIWLKEESGTD